MSAIIQYPQLNDHILHDIYELLDSSQVHKCAAVCKQWVRALDAHPPTPLRTLKRQDGTQESIAASLRTPRLRMLTEVQFGSKKKNINVDGESLKSLANLQWLTKLGLFRCVRLKDKDVHHLSRMKKLEELSIYHCHYLTGGNTMPEIAKLQHLRSLLLTIDARPSNWKQLLPAIGNGLEHLIIDGNSTSLTNSAAHAIAENCTNLLTLSMCEACEITDSGFSRIAENCTKIESLILCETGTTCGDITAFAEALCDSLIEVDISRTLVGMVGIRRLAANCKKLLSIKVACNTELGNGDIKEIAENCTHLKRLNLTKCRALTDEGVEHLMMLQELEQLNLYGCDELSPEATRLLQSHPNVAKLRQTGNVILPLHLVRVQM